MLCCGADEDVHAHIAHRGKISIHGPRVGADVIFKIHIIPGNGISIHGPRVGADYFGI